ncbi:MAG: 50S ribosomal protein L15 [Patescibacteria group bacterium]|nr:50S ribosomal protein L15 [Patescibacteria group bacterium]
MSLSLHNLKPNKKSVKKKKRVGRGNSSGTGTYSGRGIKGQRSRSGGKNKLKRLGMRQVIFATPKKKGFKSGRPKNQIVNFIDINKHFKDGSEISPKALLKVRLIDTIKVPVKILGKGKLEIKNLKFVGVKMSASVKEKIKGESKKVKKI